MRTVELLRASAISNLLGMDADITAITFAPFAEMSKT
jgi:hypothetical protein